MRLIIFFLVLTFFYSSYSQSKWELGLNLYESGISNLCSDNDLYVYGNKEYDYRFKQDLIPGIIAKRNWDEHAFRIRIEPSSRQITLAAEDFPSPKLIKYNQFQTTIGYQYKLLSRSRLSCYAALDLGMTFGTLESNRYGPFWMYPINYNSLVLNPTLGIDHQISDKFNFTLETSLLLERNKTLGIPNPERSALKNWIPISALTIMYRMD